MKLRISRMTAFIPLRSSFLMIALAVLFVSTFTFASTPQGTFEKTFQVNGPVDLEVLTHSGDISMRSGPAGSVFIRGKIYVGDHWLFGNRHADVSDIEQHPPLRQEGNSIHIDYVNARDISIDYERFVCRQARAMWKRAGSRERCAAAPAAATSRWKRPVPATSTCTPVPAT